MFFRLLFMFFLILIDDARLFSKEALMIHILPAMSERPPFSVTLLVMGPNQCS